MEESRNPIWRQILSRPKWIAAGAVAAILLILMVQNTEPVTLDILFWTLGPFAKLWLIIGAFLAGAVFAWTAGYLRRR